MLSSINEVSLIQVSSCSNTGSLRDDSYWTSRKNSLELIELSSVNKVGLVSVFSRSNTGLMNDDPYGTSRKNSLELIKLPCKNKVGLVSVFSTYLPTMDLYVKQLIKLSSINEVSLV